MRSLGPYTAGEIPEPLTVTFKDSDGQPINLSGFDASWIIRRANDDPIAAVAAVASDQDENTGDVTYTWVEGDLEEAGFYRAEMWVEDDTNRLASEMFSFYVRPALDEPAFGS